MEIEELERQLQASNAQVAALMVLSHSLARSTYYLVYCDCPFFSLQSTSQHSRDSVTLATDSIPPPIPSRMHMVRGIY